MRLSEPVPSSSASADPLEATSPERPELCRLDVWLEELTRAVETLGLEPRPSTAKGRRPFVLVSDSERG